MESGVVPPHSRSRQLVRDVFVEDFLDGQGDDHLAGLLEELPGFAAQIADACPYIDVLRYLTCI